MVGSILVIDAIATNRVVLKVKLSAAGYQPLLAADGATGLAIAEANDPDLVLVDQALGGMAVQDFIRQIRALPRLAQVPLLVMSNVSDLSLRLAALKAGADDFLAKPLDEQALLSRVRNLMRASEISKSLADTPEALAALGLAEEQLDFEPKGRVALITEKPEDALRLRHQLSAASQHRFVVLQPEEVLFGQASQEPMDAFVIDASLGNAGSGIRLMSELTSRAFSRTARFLIRGLGAGAAAAQVAYDIGADEVLAFDMDPTEIACRLDRQILRKRHADALRDRLRNGLKMAVVDPLTGLHNRRFGLTRLGDILGQARRSAEGVAVLLIDIDRFKSVNDRFGHGVGDKVLVEVARRLKSGLRAQDVLARHGGEEFLAVLPQCDLAPAHAIAQRLCDQIEGRAIILPDGQGLTVTISVGLAHLDPQALLRDQSLPASPADLIEQADIALLQSKRSGRNRVTIAAAA